MSWWQKVLAGLNLINQIVPAIVSAALGSPVRIRKIRFTAAGKTLEIAGATGIPGTGQEADDLIVSVR